MTRADKERLLALTDGNDYGICCPPMKAQVALDELCGFFLGDDWCTVMPLSRGQINTEMVVMIEELYDASWLRKRLRRR
jgi:hypothetical protein